ncbi:MAG: phenylacetate--CoA ligase [Candidatus Eisenbacteria bacterium]|uniref:Phenylacetate-coenzyme A ligase n=1 Tax=Eiseniibacteriota bacterium TaxID=2212470 RepID=A0A938BSC5_UNCEI|nr:phenylacetate--CoA ligase [Candidatus Eisenbacteria bacterium]
MPPSGMERAQLQHLQATLARVHEKIPFYRKAFDSRGLTPGDLRALPDLARFPFTIKTDLRDHYPLGLCTVPVRELSRIHASSGTTGKPITGPYTADDMHQWGECMARAMWAQGVRPDDVVQNAYGLGLFTGGLGFQLGFERIGCAVIPSGSGQTERQILLLEDLGATVLACTPTYALTIAERARQLDKDPTRFSLRVGLFGAEPWSTEMKKLIEERLGIVAHEHYGLTELMGPGVAYSCEAGRLHINEDHVYAEVIDAETLQPKPLGEKGELVLTSLQRQAMPMIRYRTRDITRLARVDCPCGRTAITMEKVTGRSDDMMIVGGVNVFPSQIESVLMEFEEIEPQYVIRLFKKGFLDAIRVETEAKAAVYAGGSGAVERLAAAVAGRLQQVIGIRAPVSILPAGSIPRSVGKAKRIIDEREAAQ